ncbi:MAG: hypothetical protein HQ464_14980, partial [Planctomycetes bacterium]|nr:hypothetical protein [Planctomycetota bacterium]
MRQFVGPWSCRLHGCRTGPLRACRHCHAGSLAKPRAGEPARPGAHDISRGAVDDQIPHEEFFHRLRSILCDGLAFDLHTAAAGDPRHVRPRRRLRLPRGKFHRPVENHIERARPHRSAAADGDNAVNEPSGEPVKIHPSLPVHIERSGRLAARVRNGCRDDRLRGWRHRPSEAERFEAAHAGSQWHLEAARAIYRESIPAAIKLDQRPFQIEPPTTNLRRPSRHDRARIKPRGPSDLHLVAAERAKRVESLLNTAFVTAARSLDEATQGMRITGFAGSPGETRADRDAQYFFVNGRYVR